MELNRLREVTPEQLLGHPATARHRPVPHHPPRRQTPAVKLRLVPRNQHHARQPDQHVEQRDVPRKLELAPIQATLRTTRRHQIRRISIDKGTGPPSPFPQVRYPIAHDDVVATTATAKTSDTVPRNGNHPSVTINPNIHQRRSFPEKHRTTAQERLNVHLVRRHLTDDPLSHTRTGLTTRVTQLEPHIIPKHQQTTPPLEGPR